MTQRFGPDATHISRLLIFLFALILLLLLVLLYLFSRSPLRQELGHFPLQTIPFSHKHHVGSLGIDCRYCHNQVDTSRFAGMPDTQTCMSCHSQLWTESEMLAPLRESFAEGRPLTWQRVHDMPDYVYFSHRAHVNNGVACETCHGRVDRMPLIKQSKPMTMRWCLDCHREPEPNLRSPGNATVMGAGEGITADSDLLELYHIDVQGLTDCVVCHR